MTRWWGETLRTEASTRMRGVRDGRAVEEFEHRDLGRSEDFFLTRFVFRHSSVREVVTPLGCTTDQRCRRELGALMERGFDPLTLEWFIGGGWGPAYRDVWEGPVGGQDKRFRDDLNLFAKYQEQVVRLHGCVCPVGAEAGCRGALCPRRGGV